jgi:hypothetical protein
MQLFCALRGIFSTGRGSLERGDGPHQFLMNGTDPRIFQRRHFSQDVSGRGLIFRKQVTGFCRAAAR